MGFEPDYVTEAKADQVALGARQQRFELDSSLHERQLTEVALVQLEEIEAIHARRHMPAVKER